MQKNVNIILHAKSICKIWRYLLMKNFGRISSIIILSVMMVSMSACGKQQVSQNESQNTSYSEQVVQNKQTEESKQAPKTIELDDFNKIIEDLESDKNYDAATMSYEIYVEKVMVNSEDESAPKTEIIVASKAKVSENKIIEKAIAAQYPYLDSFAENGPEMDAKTEWNVTDEVGYSAESIINEALKFMNINESDMQLYERYTIHSTF